MHETVTSLHLCVNAMTVVCVVWIEKKRLCGLILSAQICSFLSFTSLFLKATSSSLISSKAEQMFHEITASFSYAYFWSFDSNKEEVFYLQSLDLDPTIKF